jgi:hypothetical protein
VADAHAVDALQPRPVLQPQLQNLTTCVRLRVRTLGVTQSHTHMYSVAIGVVVVVPSGAEPGLHLPLQ